MPQPPRSQIALLTMLIFLDHMGLAIVVVLLPQLFLDSHGTFLPAAWLAPQRLTLLGLCLGVYPFGQFFGAMIFGKLSDHYGRKAVLTCTILGTLLGFALSATAIAASTYILLICSRLLAGLCAGNAAVAQASLADLSVDQHSKAHYLSLGQMAMGSAYIIGPMLGGVLSNSALVSWFDVSTPFWSFAAILLATLVLIRILYRETLTQRHSGRIAVTRGAAQIYTAFTHRTLRFAFLLWFTFIAGWWLFEAFMPAFLFQRFHFSTTSIGTLLAFNGALYAAFQYLVVKPLTPVLSAYQMVSYSGFLVGAAILAMTVLTTVPELYLAMVVFVTAMGFAIPGYITALSERADRGDQGQIMGMIGAVQALATVLVMFAGGYLSALAATLPVAGGGLLILLSWLLFAKHAREWNAKAGEVEPLATIQLGSEQAGE
ncbi:MAG TPA: MFS transporter [Steroidobacteraceae bacterium]